MGTLDERVISAVSSHPSVRRVQLVGSRAEGRATPRSDWDFVVEAEDFERVAADLPGMCASLSPIVQQWDRLSERMCFMLILRGPIKVDLIFADQPHMSEPPWEVTGKSLPAIDSHFWDWMLWLRGKDAAGKTALVQSELDKLYHHLLAPLGAREPPASLAAAVAAYRRLRHAAEQRFDVRVPRDVEAEVGAGLNL